MEGAHKGSINSDMHKLKDTKQTKKGSFLRGVVEEQHVLDSFKSPVRQRQLQLVAGR